MIKRQAEQRDVVVAQPLPHAAPIAADAWSDAAGALRAFERAMRRRHRSSAALVSFA